MPTAMTAATLSACNFVAQLDNDRRGTTFTGPPIRSKQSTPPRPVPGNLAPRLELAALKSIGCAAQSDLPGLPRQALAT